MWPGLPCLSNLVLFDPMKPTHSVDNLIGELAERWSWQENYRKLVFFLRRDVKWHDGKPFTCRDVKATFDMLREAPEAPAKLRFNPRKEWWANVEAVDAIDPLTVVFRLKRPQPSLLLMLASGYTPIYAAHVPAASYRAGCVGTGPFKLKEWRKGEFVEYVKNTDYFVKGRPYLDGVRYLIIAERGTAPPAGGRDRIRSRQSPEDRNGHPQPPGLRRPECLRDQRAQARRHRCLAEAGGLIPVVFHAGTRGVSARHGSQRSRARRPRRELL